MPVEMGKAYLTHYDPLMSRISSYVCLLMKSTIIYLCRLKKWEEKATFPFFLAEESC